MAIGDAPRAALRVELVLPYLVRGGMETMVARLARAMALRGHAVGVTCTQFGGPLAADLEADGIRVSIVPTLGILANAHAPRLERWLRSLQLDVVHVHSGTWLKTARAARKAGVPRVVHTVHGLLDRERWHDALQKRWAARYTDHVVVVSEPLRQFIASQVSRPSDSIHLIPNGIDTERFRPGQRTGLMRQHAAIPADAIVIGNVARLQDVKHHELLIDAFSGLARRVANAHLVIVGEGPLRQALASQVERLGLRDRVHLVGATADPAPVYREFDLYVLSSKAEGTSMSLLEAMASGIPVVATAVGGTPDLLGHGLRGRLVPPGEAGPLERAMYEALTEQAALDTTEIARDVERMYSESAMVSAYERLYGVAGVASTGHARREAVACVE